MKVLFIFSLDDILKPDKPLRNQDQIQFGISYISALLKSNGHQTKLIILSRILGSANRKRLAQAVIEFRPGLVCYTAVATQYEFLAEHAAWSKREFPEIYNIIGGPHASLNPDAVSRETGFDAICVGEGEYPVLELANRLASSQKPSGIKNLWLRQNNNWEKNAARPFLEDLDSLPFPDREMWQEWIEEQPGSRHAIILGRGCPFDCTYCCNHALKRIADGRYYRLRSPGNIVEELEDVYRHFPNNREIYLEVETIGVDIPWVLDLCSRIRRFNDMNGKPFSYGVNLRIIPGRDFEPLFRAFRDSNFRFLNIGLESGSEKIRSTILKRQYKNEDVINIVKLARRYGLKVAFFNMIGLPGERYEDFLETVRINRICQPDWHYTSIFYPYPGTELERIAREQGLIKGHLDPRTERARATLDLPGFSRRRIRRSYIWFDYLVYRGRRPWHYWLYAAFLKNLQGTYYFKFYLSQMIKRVAALKYIKQFLRKRLASNAYIIENK